MWTEDDIKRLKQQEQAMLRQVGKAPRDEAQVIKAAKAAEKTVAKAERAALKSTERTARAMANAERRDALKEWKREVAAADATRKAAKKQQWDTWPDAPAKKAKKWDAGMGEPAKGKWQREPDYYTDDYHSQERRGGCGCFSFSVATVLALLFLLLLAQLASQ